MFNKRLCMTILVSLFGLGLVGSVHAKTFSLVDGSGAQLHIGGGLALPIQPAATVLVTGQVFPPLLIPKATVSQTVMGTTNMTGMAPKLTVPTAALKKLATQTTVGVFTSNPTLYAVATNLTYSWPKTVATFAVSNAVRSAGQTSVGFVGAAMGNTIVYKERVIGKRFGGAGIFNINPGLPAGKFNGPSATYPLNLSAAITIYALAVPTAGAGNPPCHHPALNSAINPLIWPPPGNPACVAALISAGPTGPQVGGGPVGGTVMTAPVNAFPGIYVGAFGTGPLKPAGPAGSVSFATPTPNANPGPTNMATSTGFPFTTAKITISAFSAMGAPEKFVISGNDTRSGGGNGVLQMVSGSLSARKLSGNNANRQWVRLIMADLPGPPPVPAMSPPMQAVTVGLIILLTVGGGYLVRSRRHSA